MGWLFMQSLGAIETPGAYLDDQFTYEKEGVRSTVLRSALVKKRTYYAAVEQLRPGQEREVFAIACLVRYNPRDREGYIFGYKDMTEHMGPCEAECPAAILDLLTPIDAEYAVAWRERCRAAVASRTARPRLRNGWTLVSEEAVRFADGSSHVRLDVVIEPSRPRAIRFRPSGGGPLCRIGNLGRYRFRIEATG